VFCTHTPIAGASAPNASPDDPFAVDELPENSSFQFQMNAGVMRVYRDADALSHGVAEPWSTHNMAVAEQFHADHALMLQLISDGPL
jgi:hypothetical protein